MTVSCFQNIYFIDIGIPKTNKIYRQMALDLLAVADRFQLNGLKEMADQVNPWSPNIFIIYLNLDFA